MNTDSADTRHPHLDLEDLIAGAAGQPVGDRARAHLASCEQCRREASRWNLVADGVRALAADAPGTEAGAAGPGTAGPGRPRGRGLARHWRRGLLVAGSVAAALVLVLGIGTVTGYVHVHLNGSGAGPALTAVNGCTQVKQAEGALQAVNGNRLVVKTAGGQPVTVTTTANTFVSVSGPLLGDVTNGAAVTVHGTRSGRALDARVIAVGPPSSAVHPAALVSAQGTVAGDGPTGFTLVTAAGDRIPVVTSGDTLVVLLHPRLSQLPAGAAVFAIGQPGSDGTLAARAVAVIRQLPSGPAVGVTLRDCSASSIEAALGALSTTPRAAG
jgi:hypothetical protein